jgi:hypothetical protein
MHEADTHVRTACLDIINYCNMHIYITIFLVCVLSNKYKYAKIWHTYLLTSI